MFDLPPTHGPHVHELLNVFQQIVSVDNLDNLGAMFAPVRKAFHDDRKVVAEFFDRKAQLSKTWSNVSETAIALLIPTLSLYRMDKGLRFICFSICAASFWRSAAWVVPSVYTAPWRHYHQSHYGLSTQISKPLSAKTISAQIEPQKCLVYRESVA
jgi:hypothetical protein